MKSAKPPMREARKLQKKLAPARKLLGKTGKDQYLTWPQKTRLNDIRYQLHHAIWQYNALLEELAE